MLEPVRRNALILGGFALIMALALATTQMLTRERISAAQKHTAQQALLQIVSRAEHDNDLLEDTLPLTDPARLGLQQGLVHVARQNGELVAFIFPARAADGYSGDIDLWVGVRPNGELAGVRVTAHRETPGLGDKIDVKKHPWILDFKGRSLKNPKPELWQVRKDGGVFDQFTGATITPRAVVRQVYRVLELFEEQPPVVPALPAAETES